MKKISILVIGFLMFSSFSNLAHASVAQCNDNLDNDGDSLVDIMDPGCHSDGDATNSASYVPTDNTELNCSNQMGPNAQEIQNGDTLVQSGWGVNKNKNFTYNAKIRMGTGNISSLPWTVLSNPSIPLPYACTGWIYINTIPVASLYNGEKIQFQAYMQSPAGVTFKSPISTFIYKVGMRSDGSTFSSLEELPLGIEFTSIKVTGEGSFDTSKVITKFIEQTTKNLVK